MPNSIDLIKAQALGRILEVARKANIETDILNSAIHNQVMTARNPSARADALEKAYQKGLLSPTLKQRAAAYPELAGLNYYLSVFGEVEVERHFNAILYHNSPGVIVDVITEADQGRWLKGERGQALKTELLKTKHNPHLMFDIYKTAYNIGLLSGTDAPQVVSQIFAHPKPIDLKHALLEIRNQSLFSRLFGVSNASDVIAHPNPQAYIQATAEAKSFGLLALKLSDVIQTKLKASKEPVALVRALNVFSLSTGLSEELINRLAGRTDITEVAQALRIVFEGGVPVEHALEKLLEKYKEDTTQRAQQLVGIHKEYKKLGVMNDQEVDLILAQRHPDSVRGALKQHHKSTFFRASNDGELRQAIIKHEDSAGLVQLIAKLKMVGYPVYTLNDTDKEGVFKHSNPSEAASALASAYQAGLFNMSLNNYLREHWALPADVLAYVGYFNILTNQVRNEANLKTIIHSRNPEAFAAMIEVMGPAGLLSGAKGQQHFEALATSLNTLCGRGNRLLELWKRVPADALTEDKWNNLMTTINLSVIREEQKSNWVESYIRAELVPAPAPAPDVAI